MNRKLISAVVVAALAGLAVWLFAFRGRGSDAKPVATGKRSAEIKPGPTAAKPADGPAPKGRAPQWSIDADPEGPLRLEGQVVDPDGHPVGGAQVWITTVPPRAAKSEADGGFAFDKLVGRDYALTAAHGDLLAGPVQFKLTDKSDPVVLHLGEGATIVVKVAGDDDKPIAGADVKVAAMGDRSVKTGESGEATIKPVHPGWVAVDATAPGYAPSGGFTTVGSAGATGHLEIKLHKGVAVSGRVIDESGKPVAKAKVSVVGAWGMTRGDGTQSDDKGQFTIAAIAAGTHTLEAADDDHAPSHSAPVTVGERAVTGIEIKMKAGGTLAGIVVDADGKPVKFATVRVAGAGRQMWMGAARQATSDVAGKFELRGLGRDKLQVRAESDTAASKVLDVDLHEPAVKKDLKLVLDVTGTIAGTVVDDHGQPVPEIQVNAFPDVLGGQDASVLAGLSSATTDGGGGFAIHGLPDGTYKLWAARANGGWRDWGEQGTQAKTGDTKVKITLSAPGSLIGKIALQATGAPPKLASVTVGYQPPTPATGGVFEVKDLTPGNYDIHLRGPEFAELIQHDIKIEAGKATDLGTITVMRGRVLAGKVVDGNGTPVAGAKVRVGDMLFSIGGAEDQMENFEEMSGMRSAISDQDGDFKIIGVPVKETNVAADHPDRGRSLAQHVAGGSDDPPPVTLALHGFGSIVGKVTLKGQPQSGVTITDTAKGASAQATIVQTDGDGAFAIPKALEGTHVLNAMQTSGLGMSIKSTSVTIGVTQGKQTSVAIDIPVGTIALSVVVRALPGNQVDAAQVFLFGGAVAAATASQLTDSFLQGSVKGMKFWLGAGKPAPEFDELVAGDYSVCTVPITGSMSDPQFMQRLQENMQLLKVYCKMVKVAPSPTAQSVTQDVPSMVQLPSGGGSGAGSGSGH